MQLDLHVHTKYSFDCRMNPARVLRIARRRGLDGLAITDHDTIEGALEARRLAKGNFLVIIGEEVSTTGGDIIGLFLREKIEGGEPAGVIDRIHAQGGVAVLPHPFSKTLGVDEKVAQKLDACEGFNARYSSGEGQTAVGPFALEYGLTLTGASDAHRYRDIGQGRTIAPDGPPERIKEALLNGSVSFAPHRPGPGVSLLYGVLDTLAWVVDPIPERMLYHHHVPE